MTLWHYIHWVALIVAVSTEIIQISNANEPKFNYNVQRNKRLVNRESKHVPETLPSTQLDKNDEAKNDGHDATIRHKTNRGDEENYDYPAAVFNRAHLREVNWKISEGVTKINTTSTARKEPEPEPRKQKSLVDDLLTLSL